MAEKEFKIQNGLRVLEEAYFQSDLTVSGDLILSNSLILDNTIVSSSSFIPSQDGQNGKYLTTDGSVASWSTVSASLLPTVSISSNSSLSSNNRYFVDTSSARTLTLPASPASGDEIQIFDVSGNAATNIITVNSNSNKINGTVQNLEIDLAFDAVSLIYTGSVYGWKVI